MKNLEKLAEQQHLIWSHWMKYQFSKCRPQVIKSFNYLTKQEEEIQTGNLVIPKELVDRWTRQINTEYSELNEREKESDRVQVRKFADYL